MDEWILDDLLECSVCLERLDTTSKVLPCQHTFCKKCLEEILRTHSELRCPECRTLVQTKIDDLPPNVLLMRILEGLGSAGRRIISRTGVPNIVNTVGSGSSTSASQSQSITSGTGTRNLPYSTNTQQIAHNEINESTDTSTSSGQHPLPVYQNQPCARATYDYLSKEPGDLSFKKGDVIHLRKKLDSNWYHGECNGNQGVFPLRYVQIVVPLPTHGHAQCKALYDFKMANDEEDGCLVFHKGDIITVVRRVDENWAEGKLGDKIGIFPLAFVELNSIAKALLKPQQLDQASSSRVIASSTTGAATPDDGTIVNQHQVQVTPLGTLPVTSDSSSTSLTSPSSSCSSTTTPTTSSSNHSSPSSPPPPPAPNKRHSFGTPTVHSTNNIKLNRHSAEILNVPEGFIAQSSHNADHMTVEQHSQLVRHGSQRHRKSCEVVPAPGPQLQTSLFHLPAAYVALYPYKPQKGDELELKRGAIYKVTERCQDGWFKGTAAGGQKAGVFPGNYVAPAKRSIPVRGGLCRNTGTSSSSPRNGTPPVEIRSFVTYTKSAIGSVNSQIQPQVSESRNQVSADSQQINVTPSTNASKSTDKTQSREKKEKCGVSLMRRLASMKISKSPPPAPYFLDNPVFEDLSFNQHVHIRSGSCPNQLLTSSNLEASHRVYSPTSSHRSKQRVRPSLPRLSTRTDGEWSPPGNIEHRKCNSMDSTSQSILVSSQDINTISAGIGGRLAADDLITSPSTASRTAANEHPILPPPRTVVHHDLTNVQQPPEYIPLRQNNHLEHTGVQTSRLNSNTNEIIPANENDENRQILVRRSQGGDISSHHDSKVTSSSTTTNHPRTSSSASVATTVGSSSITHTSSTSSAPHKTLTSSKGQQTSSSGSHHVRERFRCIVPYPPNSEYELELRLGDVIYVHKKREDGWYKGIQQRTGRTGLFPASFVQSF